MTDNVLEQYVALRRQLFNLEAELEQLKGRAIAQLKAQGRVAYIGDYELQVRSYTAWEYSAAVSQLQEQLNESRRAERESGRARVKERRDMLVLRSNRSDAATARKLAEDSEEWLAD